MLTTGMLQVNRIKKGEECKTNIFSVIRVNNRASISVLCKLESEKVMALINFQELP